MAVIAFQPTVVFFCLSHDFVISIEITLKKSDEQSKSKKCLAVKNNDKMSVLFTRYNRFRIGHEHTDEAGE